MVKITKMYFTVFDCKKLFGRLRAVLDFFNATRQ